MKKITSIILQDNAIKYSLISSAGLFLLLVTLFTFQYKKLPPVIPLFNSLPWGNSRLVSVQALFIIPIFLLFVSGVNVFLANRLYKKYTILARMLSVNILLATILVTIAFVQIILLVF